MSRPRPFAASKRGDGRRRERVGADAVHRVGRQHDQVAAAHRPGRLAHAGGALLGVVAGVHRHERLLRRRSLRRCDHAARSRSGRVQQDLAGRRSATKRPDARNISATASSLLVAVLDSDQATVAQQSAAGRFDHARTVQTVSAAPQRGGRIVIANLGFEVCRAASRAGTAGC